MNCRLDLPRSGLTCFPDPPHINTFLVYAAGDADLVNERLLGFLERERVALSGPWRPADVPGRIVTELFVHPGTLAHDPAAVAAWFADVVG